MQNGNDKVTGQADPSEQEQQAREQKEFDHFIDLDAPQLGQVSGGISKIMNM